MVSWGGDGLHQVGDAGHLGVAAGDVAHRLPEELEGGGHQPQVRRGGEVGGKVHQLLPGLLAVVLGGQVAGGVEEGKGGVVVGVGRVVVVAQQGIQKAGDVPRPGVVQHGLHHQLQGVADVGALLGVVLWSGKIIMSRYWPHRVKGTSSAGSFWASAGTSLR